VPDLLDGRPFELAEAAHPWLSWAGRLQMAVESSVCKACDLAVCRVAVWAVGGSPAVRTRMDPPRRSCRSRGHVLYLAYWRMTV